MMNTFNPAEKAYNYREALKNDIRSFMADNDYKHYGDSREEVENNLYDDLWTADSVTGNASGSYTFSRWEAENNLCHNWDLASEALQAFGQSLGEAAERGAEYIDLSIRCYLLGEVLSEVLDEEYTEPEEDEEE